MTCWNNIFFVSNKIIYNWAKKIFPYPMWNEISISESWSLHLIKHITNYRYMISSCFLSWWQAVNFLRPYIITLLMFNYAMYVMLATFELVAVYMLCCELAFGYRITKILEGGLEFQGVKSDPNLLGRLTDMVYDVLPWHRFNQTRTFDLYHIALQWQNFYDKSLLLP